MVSNLGCEVLVIICYVAVIEGAMKARQLYNVPWGSLIRVGFGNPFCYGSFPDLTCRKAAYLAGGTTT
jgi:hypothetical protein